MKKENEVVTVDSKMSKLQKGDMVIVPTTVLEVQEFVKSVMGTVTLPRELSDKDAFAIIVKGQEMGTPPMASLQNIFIIYGKMGMYTDFAMGLIRNHPEYAGMKLTEIEKDGQFEGYKCTMKRKAVRFEDEISSSFTITDARMRGLDKKNPSYRTMPKIMCKKRAISQVSRELFDDVLHGVYTRLEIEEMQINNPEPLVVEEGKDFEVVEEPELVIAIEEVEAEKGINEIKKDIADSYKKLMALIPEDWTIDYILAHNEKFLGTNDSKQCNDIDKLKELLADLEGQITKIEKEELPNG